MCKIFNVRWWREPHKQHKQQLHDTTIISQPGQRDTPIKFFPLWVCFVHFLQFYTYSNVYVAIWKYSYITPFDHWRGTPTKIVFSLQILYVCYLQFCTYSIVFITICTYLHRMKFYHSAGILKIILGVIYLLLRLVLLC